MKAIALFLFAVLPAASVANAGVDQQTSDRQQSQDQQRSLTSMSKTFFSDEPLESVFTLKLETQTGSLSSDDQKKFAILVKDFYNWLVETEYDDVHAHHMDSATISSVQTYTPPTTRRLNRESSSLEVKVTVNGSCCGCSGAGYTNDTNNRRRDRKLLRGNSKIPGVPDKLVLGNRALKVLAAYGLGNIVGITILREDVKL